MNLESNELSAISGSLILSAREAKLLAMFLEKEVVSYSIDDIVTQVFQGDVGTDEITLYVAYLNNKLTQIHGKIRLIEEDGKIHLKKEESV